MVKEFWRKAVSQGEADFSGAQCTVWGYRWELNQVMYSTQANMDFIRSYYWNLQSIERP